MRRSGFILALLDVHISRSSHIDLSTPSLFLSLAYTHMHIYTLSLYHSIPFSLSLLLTHTPLFLSL